MHKHARNDSVTWICCDTGKETSQVWTCHKRWKACGHAFNECEHCSEDGSRSIGEMLHKLNEKAKQEHYARSGTPQSVVRNDGGRAAAGYKGSTGDCVTRAIAIATGKPYQEVYDSLNELAKKERKGKRKRGISSARTGVYPATTRKYMESIGWKWTPTMTIGSGCKVHLKPGELPKGRLVVKVSRHLVAVIDGVVHDTHDSSRNGTRCVYGYYSKD